MVRGMDAGGMKRRLALTMRRRRAVGDDRRELQLGTAGRPALRGHRTRVAGVRAGAPFETGCRLPVAAPVQVGVHEHRQLVGRDAAAAGHSVVSWPRPGSLPRRLAAAARHSPPPPLVGLPCHPGAFENSCVRDKECCQQVRCLHYLHLGQRRCRRHTAQHKLEAAILLHLGYTERVCSSDMQLLHTVVRQSRAACTSPAASPAARSQRFLRFLPPPAAFAAASGSTTFSTSACRPASAVRLQPRRGNKGCGGACIRRRVGLMGLGAWDAVQGCHALRSRRHASAKPNHTACDRGPPARAAIQARCWSDSRSRGPFTSDSLAARWPACHSSRSGMPPVGPTAGGRHGR